MVNIAMNRAVHLARRDAHYRRCIELLEARRSEASIVKRRGRIEEILKRLSEARYEAICAMRGNRSWRTEKIFVKYLDLIYDAAQAAQVMIQHEALLRADKSFLKRLLGVGMARLTQFEDRHRSMEGEILDGIVVLVMYASSTYSELKKANIDSLSPNDKARYRVAYSAVHPGE